MPGPELSTLWRRARVETALPYAVAAATLAGGVILLGHEIGRHIEGLEEWIAGVGSWGVAVFVVLYALLSSVFVPDILFGIVAGASFGFFLGLGATAAGSLAGAALQYALSRRLLQPAITRFLASKPALAAIQVAVRQQELWLQFLIRLTPLNRALTSYTLGAAGVGFTRFVVACIGLLPSLCLEVYVGYAGKHLARMTSRPEHTIVLHDVVVIGGLGVAIAVMVLISRTARRAVEVAAASVPSHSAIVT